jgi:chaperone required for assembly of F1-ATPase
VKRFYGHAAVGTGGGANGVELDGRVIKTLARRPLVVPNAALAEAVAAEWAAQVETVEPDTMPLTRLATTAIDRVADHREPVIAETAAYGATDLLCYRAAEPADLAASQVAGWQPLLDWLAESHGARLATTEGLIAIEQPEAGLARMRALVAEFDTLPLAALHMVTAASGSLVIGLALADGRIDAGEAWRLCRLDEAFQAERWGLDPETESQGEKLRVEIAAAARFLELCSQ